MHVSRDEYFSPLSIAYSLGEITHFAKEVSSSIWRSSAISSMTAKFRALVHCVSETARNLLECIEYVLLCRMTNKLADANCTPAFAIGNESTHIPYFAASLAQRFLYQPACTNGWIYIQPDVALTLRGSYFSRASWLYNILQHVTRVTWLIVHPVAMSAMPIDTETVVWNLYRQRKGFKLE